MDSATEGRIISCLYLKQPLIYFHLSSYFQKTGTKFSVIKTPTERKQLQKPSQSKYQKQKSWCRCYVMKTLNRSVWNDYVYNIFNSENWQSFREIREKEKLILPWCWRQPVPTENCFRTCRIEIGFMRKNRGTAEDFDSFRWVIIWYFTKQSMEQKHEQLVCEK